MPNVHLTYKFCYRQVIPVQWAWSLHTLRHFAWCRYQQSLHKSASFHLLLRSWTQFNLDKHAINNIQPIDPTWPFSTWGTGDPILSRLSPSQAFKPPTALNWYLITLTLLAQSCLHHHSTDLDISCLMIAWILIFQSCHCTTNWLCCYCLLPALSSIATPKYITMSLSAHTKATQLVAIINTAKRLLLLPTQHYRWYWDTQAWPN